MAQGDGGEVLKMGAGPIHPGRQASDSQVHLPGVQYMLKKSPSEGMIWSQLPGLTRGVRCYLLAGHAEDLSSPHRGALFIEHQLYANQGWGHRTALQAHL